MCSKLIILTQVTILITTNSRRYNTLLMCYDAFRDPHTFPTRRSSDLHGADLGSSGDGAGREAGQQRVERRADRKSTRLNSSHLVISYAVFCLKNKKVKRQYKKTEIKSMELL